MSEKISPIDLWLCITMKPSVETHWRVINYQVYALYQSSCWQDLPNNHMSRRLTPDVPGCFSHFSKSISVIPVRKVKNTRNQRCSPRAVLSTFVYWFKYNLLFFRNLIPLNEAKKYMNLKSNKTRWKERRRTWRWNSLNMRPRSKHYELLI